LDKQLKVKGHLTFIYHRLQGNHNCSSLQFEVAYWPALAIGSSAQLAATHCPNRLTFCSLQLNRPTYAPASCTTAFTLQCSPATTLFSSKYYHELIANHIRTQRDGRLSWPEL